MAHALKFLAFLMLILIQCISTQAVRSDYSAIRILFVGNSLTYYNDVPAMVSEIYSSIDQQYVIETDMLAQGGYSIKQHLANGPLESVLADLMYDVVVLQDFGGWPLCSTSIEACSPTSEPLSRAIELVRSSGARPIWYSTYHNHPAGQRELSDEARRIAAQLNVEVADVGAALQAFISTNDSAEVFLSNHHPNTLGSWIAAATIVRSVIGKDIPGSIELDTLCRKIWQGAGLTANRLASNQEQPDTSCDRPTSSVLQEVVEAVNKTFKFVPALRASTGPKKAAPFWAA